MKSDCVHIIHKRLHLALCTPSQAKSLVFSSSSTFRIVPGISALVTAEGENRPPSIADIYNYGHQLHNIYYSGNNRKRIIVCGGQDSTSIANSLLGLGGFLLLFKGVVLDEVIQSLEPLQERLLGYHQHSHFALSSEKISVIDCLRALDTARNLGWIRFKLTGSIISDQSKICFDMEEYIHYDGAANGNFNIVIPGKLLVFHRPCQHLPCTRTWQDDAHGRRHFASGYYAALFAEMGVQLVLRVGSNAAGYDAAAFRHHGIEVEDLLSDEGDGGGGGSSSSSSYPSSPADRGWLPMHAAAAAAAAAEVDNYATSLSDDWPPTPPAVGPACPAVGGGGLMGYLWTMDRLRALAAAAPGVLAVHGGPGGLGAAAPLLAAFLVSRHGWEARAAVAWLRMACPGPLAGAGAACGGSSDDEDGGMAPAARARHPASPPLPPSPMLSLQPAANCGHSGTGLAGWGLDERVAAAWAATEGGGWEADMVRRRSSAPAPAESPAAVASPVGAGRGRNRPAHMWA